MSDSRIGVPLTGTVEENMLTALCWSDELAPRLVMRLTDDLFSTRQHRQLALKAINHITSYGKAPGVHLRDLLETEIQRGDHGKLIEHAIDLTQQLAPHLQSAFVLDQLDTFVEIRTLKEAVREADAALDKQDLPGAKKALYEIPRIVPPSPGIWLSDANRMLSFLDKDPDDDLFSCGIAELDKRGVRPIRKTQFNFIAPAKRGKTWFLIGIGKANIRLRKKVLHITLENSAELTAQRYCQALFSMTAGEAQVIHNTYFSRDEMGRFIGFDIKDLDAEALNQNTRDTVASKLIRMKRRKLLIQEFPTGQLSIGQLIAYLDMLAQHEGFVPDLLIIDYPKLMAVDRGEYRIMLGRLMEQLRGIAVERNLAEVVVSQGNRLSANAKRVSGTHIGEDFSQIGTADTIVTYSQTGREQERHLARLGVYGARNTKDHYTVLIAQSYDIGQFCLDSTYFGKYVETELHRITGEEDDDIKED